MTDDEYKYAIRSEETPTGSLITGEIAIILSIGQNGEQLYSYKYGPEMTPYSAIGHLEIVKSMILVDICKGDFDDEFEDDE